MSRLSIEQTLTDFRRLDLLAMDDTSIHQLDGRAKVLTVLVFITAVMSFNRYEFSALLPFICFPLFLIIKGHLPATYLFKRIALVLPFAVLIGLFNPLLDRQVMVRLGSISISGGWISWASIVVRAVLTVSAALILVSVTGFTAICQALTQMGLPRAFAMQLLFLHRYLFVLIEEAKQVSRARELRSFGRTGLGIRNSGAILGNLLLRTWERAERIHLAMLARGFTGEFHTRKTAGFRGRDLLFLLGWSSVFIALRIWNMSQLLGYLVMEIVQ
ncbi:MAG: cobalt ECF transporter T component CbiQ [Desulfuromonadales bacterium]|nr:cobalt ECF transporter T component CbiQ [Desulfuromonadales bacterium]